MRRLGGSGTFTVRVNPPDRVSMHTLEPITLMVRRLLHSLQTDLHRPWGMWTKISIVGCVTSLTFLKLMIHGIMIHGGCKPKAFDPAVIPVNYVLLLSVAAGIVALTRKGTTKTVPTVALLVTFGLGWVEIAVALMWIPLHVFFTLIKLLNL